MISSTSLLSAPSTIGGVHPAGDNDAAARRLDSTKGWGAALRRPTLVPPAPVASGLARFLQQPSVELAMLHELQPVIRVSNLQDRATFDSVLQRSRRCLRDAAAQDGSHDAALQAALHTALQALDRNVVLRRQSSFTQNALFQG